MALNINSIVPAIEKAKNIATEQYVDTSVASIDVSENINSGISTNNDIFAQKLGYSNYAAMVTAAGSGKTVINSGFVNTNLIQANAITAEHINSSNALINKLNVTGGLVANNIRIAGVNGGADLMWNNDGKMVINNLQVLGTASLPGLSKTNSYDCPFTSMPSSGYIWKEIGGFYVYKPFTCSSWGMFLAVSAGNLTYTGTSKDLNCRILVNGVVVAEISSSEPWNINTVPIGSIGGLYGESYYISVQVNGNHTAGNVYGKLSVISIVES